MKVYRINEVYTTFERNRIRCRHVIYDELLNGDKFERVLESPNRGTLQFGPYLVQCTVYEPDEVLGIHPSYDNTIMVHPGSHFMFCADEDLVAIDNENGLIIQPSIPVVVYSSADKMMGDMFEELGCPEYKFLVTSRFLTMTLGPLRLHPRLESRFSVSSIAPNSTVSDGDALIVRDEEGGGKVVRIIFEQFPSTSHVQKVVDALKNA